MKITTESVDSVCGINNQSAWLKYFNRFIYCPQLRIVFIDTYYQTIVSLLRWVLRIHIIKHVIKKESRQKIGEKHCYEALNNVTLAGVYYGRKKEILTRREKIKKELCYYAADKIVFWGLQIKTRRSICKIKFDLSFRFELTETFWRHTNSK